MLIALMGDTFDRVIEQRPFASRQNKLRIMQDMNSCISKEDNSGNANRYLYLIQTKEISRQTLDDGENWRGKLFFLQEIIDVYQVKNETQVKEIKTLVESLETKMETKMNTMETNQTAIQETLAEIMSKISKLT